jgi:type IX secretion system PorP/SprF family membrane protein
MKSLKISIIAFVVLCVNIALHAQSRYFDERYVYTHSFFNPVLVNPGATGAHGSHKLLLNYRNKWSGFTGSPKSVTLSYDGLLADRLGMGILVFQDNFGALQTTKGQASFAYIIESDVNKIGFGLSAEYVKHGLNNYNASVPQDPDGVIDQRREGIEYMDASFGIHGKYDNRFTYGIALPSLISSRIDNTVGTYERELGFILNLGYKAMSSTSGISLEPSIMLKKLNQVPTHVDLNMRLGFLEDKLSGGVTYRLGADNMLGFMLGVNVERIGFYYGYGVSSQPVQDYNNGAHELTAVISLGTKAKQEILDK